MAPQPDTLQYSEGRADLFIPSCHEDYCISAFFFSASKKASIYIAHLGWAFWLQQASELSSHGTFLSFIKNGLLKITFLLSITTFPP